MGFFKIFSGKEPEEYELKGDSLFKTDAYGDAKLEYEAGLYKLEKKDSGNSELKKRLQEKILQTREALALHHKQKGEEILESEYYEDAENLFRLALELTENPELKFELEELLHKIQKCHAQQKAIDSQEMPAEKGNTGEQDFAVQEDEYFEALCASFSDKKREKAYHGYGDAFKQGYLALNHGDFKLAAARLLQAMEENPMPKTYIPLELGTVYLNLGKTEEARGLLTSFLKGYPASLQGYQMLCEALWELKEFDEAHNLLQTCHAELAESSHILLLKGETFFQAGRFEEAQSLFRDNLKSSGWDEPIALSLARTYEALGEKEKARSLYGELMGECTTCGRQIDPFIKRKYADLSLECGQCSTGILELYLSLIHEDPANKGHYYRKIIEIYYAMGDEQEARRYESLLYN